MKSRFGKLIGSRPNPAIRRAAKRTPHRSRPGIEQLESRQLLSVNVPPWQFVPVDNPNNPGVTLEAGDLVIQGSNADDTAVVSQVSEKTGHGLVTHLKVSFAHTRYLSSNVPGLPPQLPITTHDPDQYFNPGDVTKIYYFGDCGNDAFTNKTAIPCVAYGTGSDHFVGGGGDDYLQGGSGPNVLEGGGGNDTFFVGAGDNDIVFAKTDLGSVTIGGKANGHHNILDFSQFGPSGITLDLRTTAWQTVHSSNGAADLRLKLVQPGVIQEVWGSPYADVIRADDYGDIIHGNGGNDMIYGGQGADYLYGDTGSATFVTIGGGKHYVYGGKGHNTFWVNTTDVTDYSPGRDDIGDVSHFHAVAAFDTLRVVNGNTTTIQTPNLQRNGPDLLDPLPNYLNWQYASFAGHRLFSASGPSANDIHQGSADDCYFVAYLSALAKTDPDKIRQTVVDLGDGTYAVYYRKGGQDHFVRVDGDLPAVGGAPVYAGFGQDGSSIWVPIVEKAWAFFRNDQGTYASIAGGGSPGISWSQALQTPLSMHATSAFASGTDFLKAVLADLKAGKAIVMGGPPSLSATTPEPPAIHRAGTHIYMVDHVTTDKQGTPISVTLRNPYGTTGPNDDGYVTISADLAYLCCSAFGSFTV
jgi:hypothetical protein